MTQEGQIVLFRFPQTNQAPAKLRPALILRKLPGQYDDWLICMISTQLSHKIEGLDEIIGLDDVDYKDSGLKSLSLIRVTRIAVVEEIIFLGSIGEISQLRLERIKDSLSDWIKKDTAN
jgi:mRNA interferase MazF